MKNSIKAPVYIDLFAGCGGLSYGLHKAGWKGLFAIEKNPDAFETLKTNLIDKRDHFNWPDWLLQQNHDINHVIRNHKQNLVALQGKVDLVVGGPPCQGFSSAGRRKEDDSRNKLIKSYLRFISFVKPKFIFFENVKGFTIGFKKNQLKGIAYSDYVKRVLDKLGYDIKGDLVDFSNYGVPQKRTRFILVGVRKDICAFKRIEANQFFQRLEKSKYKFLKSKGLPLSVSLEDAISDLVRSNGEKSSIDTKGFNTGIYSPLKSSYQALMRENINKFEEVTPDSHRFANHTPQIIQKFKSIIRYKGDMSKISETMKTKKRIQKLLIKEKVAPTLTTLPDDYIHYCEPRILTVREYARIQSFPDAFEFKGSYTTGGKSRVLEVPRYSQIGNAIPPLFGEQSGKVFKALLSR